MKDRKHQQAQLMAAIITYYQGDPKRIHHFLKVHDFAAAIGVLEALDPQTQWILETAAIVHDTISAHQNQRRKIRQLQWQTSGGGRPALSP